MVLVPDSALAGPSVGQIVVDPDHPAWFRYHGGGPFYMAGPGDPEGFLYRGTRNPDGTRNGDQMALINKMAGTGANCIYLMAIRSHGGDGGPTENPFVNSDPNGALNQAILDQWETWFAAMDANGITIFFFFYDDSASPYGKPLPANGELKPEEAAFIDAMVGRFKHHRHLIWCVAEEYAEGLTPQHAEKIAQRIRQQDDRQHPIAIHQNSGTSFDFNGSPFFDQFAVQWNRRTPEELHAGTVAAWNNVGGLVNINMAEFGDSSYPFPFSGTGDALRHKLWAIAMGGGYAMVLGMDIASTPIEDLEACGRLVRFMEATRFNEAGPRDDLGRTDTRYVLADPGNVYLAYGLEAGGLSLLVVEGSYLVKWYNPINGVWVDIGRQAVQAGEQRFFKPQGIGDELVLYLERAFLPPEPASNPSPADGASNVPRSVVLSWTAGLDADSQAIYFGTTSPGDFQASLSGNTFDPGTLVHGTTYFWRVDGVNAFGTTAGPVWRFTTRPLPGDHDGDGDVDQADFGAFQACYGAPVLPGCEFADFNGDGLVDQTDFIMFHQCMSGANVPADPDCAD